MTRATKKQGARMPHEPWLSFLGPIFEFRNQLSNAQLPRSPEPQRLRRRNQEPGNVAWVTDNGEGGGESG